MTETLVYGIVMHDGTDRRASSSLVMPRACHDVSKTSSGWPAGTAHWVRRHQLERPGYGTLHTSGLYGLPAVYRTVCGVHRPARKRVRKTRRGPLSAMAPDPAASLETTCAALRAACLLYRTHPQLRARPPCGAVQLLWALRAPMHSVYGCRVGLNLLCMTWGPSLALRGGIYCGRLFLYIIMLLYRTNPLRFLALPAVLPMELLAPEHVARCLPAALEAAAWGLAAACDIGLHERAGAASAKGEEHATQLVPEWSWVAKSLVAGAWVAVGAAGQGCADVDAPDVARRLGRARLLRSLDTFVRLYGDKTGDEGFANLFSALGSAVWALCVLPLPLVPGAVPLPWVGVAAGVRGAGLVQGGDEAEVQQQQQQQQAGDLCGLLLSVGKGVRAIGCDVRNVEHRVAVDTVNERQHDRAHMLLALALDELVGGLAVAVDRAARLAGDMEGAAAAAAGDSSTQYSSHGGAPTHPATEALTAAAASLRGCVVYACCAACWAAAPRLEAACCVLRELPEGGRWPDTSAQPDAGSSAAAARNRTALNLGVRMVHHEGGSAPESGDPALQVPVSYPTRAAYLLGAVNTLCTTAAWLGCPLGAWLGEWRQLLPARPVQLLEAGCSLIMAVRGKWGQKEGGGSQGGAAPEQQLRLLVQGAGPLHGALVGLAAHGDDATVDRMRGWLLGSQADAFGLANGGCGDGAGGGGGGGGNRSVLVMAAAVDMRMAAVAAGTGQLDRLILCSAAQTLQQLHALACLPVEDFRKLAKDRMATGRAQYGAGGGCGGGGGEVQRVWGRERAEAAARAAGEVWWPRACAYPECRNFSEATEAELKPKLCGGCGEARYCRPECQKMLWKIGHRQECKRKGG